MFGESVLRSRITIGLIAGAIGGFLGWLLQEMLIPYRAAMIGGVCRSLPLSAVQQFEQSRFVGGIICMFLGTIDGIAESNFLKIRNGAVFGFLCGTLFAGIGFNFGGLLFHALGGSDSMPDHANVVTFVTQMIARAAGIMLLGLAVGVGSSISSGSAKRIRNGAIGGLLGGLAGGFLFDIIPTLLTPIGGALGDSGCRDVGGPARAVGFISIGVFTGFFIGLVQELLKSAWVKVLAGRNEGKDFILMKPMNILGRDEKCDVPLYGDVQVAAQHAAIRAEGVRHVLVDAGTNSGTLVNGKVVPARGEQLLRDGDMIQIGTHRILFREKSTASKYSRSPADEVKPASPASAVPMPGHLCPYCGAARDASGACLCSVGASSGSSPAFAPIPSSQPQSSPPALSPGFYAGPSVSAAPAGGTVLPVQLTALDGAMAGQGIVLTDQNMTVGRDPGSAIVLSFDTTVSRNHARLTFEAAGLVVYDNGSSNGTFVNGVRISSPMPVSVGDIVQFGASRFRLD